MHVHACRCARKGVVVCCWDRPVILYYPRAVKEVSAGALGSRSNGSLGLSPSWALLQPSVPLHLPALNVFIIPAPKPLSLSWFPHVTEWTVRNWEQAPSYLSAVHFRGTGKTAVIGHLSTVQRAAPISGKMHMCWLEERKR